MIISPCISICKTDPKTGLCYGCGRNDEEKRKWKDENTSDQWKNNNLEEIKSRLSGWQLERVLNHHIIIKLKKEFPFIKRNKKNETYAFSCNCLFYRNNYWGNIFLIFGALVI